MARGRNILKAAIRGLVQSPVEREREFYRRYRELSDKIELMPDSFTYYVLRGELLVERGEDTRARADFEMAVKLADSYDSAKEWGLLEQAMCDRALQGIDWVTRRA